MRGALCAAIRPSIVTLYAGIAVASLVSLTCGGGGSSSPTTPNPSPDVIGSGIVVQQSVEIGPFTTVDHSGVGTLLIEQGTSNSLIITAEDNLIPYLHVHNEGNTLKISTQSGIGIQTTRPIEYHLTAATLERVELEGVGGVQCDEYVGNRLSLVANGVGRLSFDNLDVDDLDVRLSGVGDVRTSGAATRQEVVVNAIDDYKGNQLSSDEADVEIQGMGSATVRVKNRLVVRIHGSGCVYYIGSPLVEAEITGSGCVEKIGD